MAKFKKKDLKTGECVYIISGGEYKIVKIIELKDILLDGTNRTQVWGSWTLGTVSVLPKTIEVYDAIEKFTEGKQFTYIENIVGKLDFSEEPCMLPVRVKQFNKPDMKIGDYVYYADEESDSYRVTKVTKITQREYRGVSKNSVWGHWSNEILNVLPRTLEEFKAIKRNMGNVKFIKMTDIDGILYFDKDSVPEIEPCTLSDRLLTLENYESSTMLALTAILGDDYDFEDALKILIPNISKIAENE